MKKVTSLIRSNTGRSALPSNYVEHMSKESKKLKHLYHLDELLFDTDCKEGKEKRPVVWANAEELLDYVVSDRKIIGHRNVKVMMDGGQGFLKVCLSVFPEIDQLSDDNNKTLRQTSVQ